MRIKLRKGLKPIPFITYKPFSSKYNHIIPIELTVTHSQHFSQSVTGNTAEYLCCKYNNTAKQNRITYSLRISQSIQLNARVSKTRIMTEKLPITE